MVTPRICPLDINTIPLGIAGIDSNPVIPQFNPPPYLILKKRTCKQDDSYPDIDPDFTLTSLLTHCLLLTKT
jgi:hypothetical protein